LTTRADATSRASRFSSSRSEGVEFATNLHTFTLPVELLLVPMASLLVATQVLADSSAEFAQTRNPIAWCLGILGAVSLSYSISYLVGHFDDVATGETIKEFLLPLVLTVCFLPFLAAVRYLMVWQTMLHMIQFGLGGDHRLYRFTRRLIFRVCGVRKAQLFESEFRGRLFGATAVAEVSRVVDDFREAWRRGRRITLEAKPPEF
jgi:hypothetical protein